MMMNKKRTRKIKKKTTNLQNRIRKINNDFYIYFHCNKTSSIHDSIPINYSVPWLLIISNYLNLGTIKLLNLN